jgi:hypothetical protein
MSLDEIKAALPGVKCARAYLAESIVCHTKFERRPIRALDILIEEMEARLEREAAKSEAPHA